jgi:hypothetical protein
LGGGARGGVRHKPPGGGSVNNKYLSVYKFLKVIISGFFFSKNEKFLVAKIF